MGILDNLLGMRTMKALYEGAESHARSMGDTSVGAEHLLLSAFDLPDGAARRAFSRAGGDPDGFEEAIVRQHEDALRLIGLEPVPEARLRGGRRRQGPKPNESLIQVLKVSSALGKLEDVHGLGAQVVVGVARLEHGTAARAIAAMGLDRTALADAARAEGRRAA